MQSTSQRGLAVITGAAGGLGLSFARQLAQRGYRLLLIDRRQAPLEQVCATIAAEYGTTAEPYTIDLCKRDEVERLAERLEQTPDVELLVNNAGFGTVGYFADTDANYLVAMVDVHVVAPTMLTRAVLPQMIERNSGNVINVSSLAGWFHSAGNTQYGCTKNYLAGLSLALQDELRGTNVRVQALCPGFVRTEFHSAETMKGFNQRWAPAAHFWMSADEVVACSLRCLQGNKVIVIPGLGYSIAGRFAQMPVIRRLIQWLTRVPRLAPSPPPHVDTCPSPTLSVAKRG
ncbi:SDR family NAD(P)-dependent oxidoreductase [Anatilimnocola sp. NA78]|uniref:SDR family NAD(P)-dependent oxidoreductase n=1 Tax=Anatilimnocola sp. NA78 TaxID=3415683 RepID=UPI003CE515E9